MFVLALALEVVKPTGLFLSAPDNTAINHPEARGTLVRVFWSEVESTKNRYNFESVRRQLARVSAAKKGWSLAIVAGQHAPSYLSEDASIPKVRFNFRGTTPIAVPAQWNTEVQTRLKLLAKAAAKEFANDETLKLVYVPQMTANGIEGHFNGCPDSALDEAGFSEDKWVQGVEQTAADFATAFLGKALAVEVHDIKRSAKPGGRIITDLWNNASLGHRVGAAIWWLSGKSDYQADLLKTIKDFPGDKYAQVIARSTDIAKFQNNDYTSIFKQAKELGIRYIEPWEVEFKGSTFDESFKSFNRWADQKFGQ